MSFNSIVFTNCDISIAVRHMNGLAQTALEEHGGIYRLIALAFSIEIAATPDSLLRGPETMSRLGIRDDFFVDFDVSEFVTTIEIECFDASFSTSLLPLADSIAAAISKDASVKCLVFDESASQPICEYQSGSVSRLFEYSDEYAEGLYWKPNFPKH